MQQRLLNRQARRINASDYMAIAADATWSYYGEEHSLTVTLDYLDI
jgi:hypothetical protein